MIQYMDLLPKEKDIQLLWRSVGWRDEDEYAHVTYNALKGADFRVFAYDRGRLVGCTSAITDGWNVYICYVCVDKEYHGQGIGSELLRLLLEEYEGKRIYVATEKARGFYEKNGFKLKFDMLIKFPYER